MAENKDDLVFRIVVAADIERVWRELTKTDEAQGAVFNAWLHTRGGVRAGSPMQMRSGSGKRTLVVGEIVECDRPRRFVHTHRFTQYDDAPCQVSYELKPVTGGVEVTLRVSGVVAGSKTAKDMAGGGTMIVGTLKAICETGRPNFGTRLMYLVFKYMEFVLPAKTKSEHWPL
jgi:uncharacterized protein YndB with AHSA1/START domain